MTSSSCCDTQSHTHATAMQKESSLSNDERSPRKHAIHQWLQESAWPGLGLFGESYVLFSLGTLQPLWSLLMPECWGSRRSSSEDDAYGDATYDPMEDSSTSNSCSQSLLDSLTYSVVLGVMVGMVGFGWLANRIGRRRGSIATATLMALGASGLTVVSLLLVDRPRRLVQSMAALLFVFGVGVGGEYPLSACSASERTMDAETNTHSRQIPEASQDGLMKHNESSTPQRRGRAVQLVFAMQGMGIFFNSFIMMILLLVTGQTGNDGIYDHKALKFIWNATYAFGAAILLYVLISRCRHLEESAAWQRDKLQREQLAENDSPFKPENILASKKSTGHRNETRSATASRSDQYYSVSALNDAKANTARRINNSSDNCAPDPISSPSASSVSSLSAPSVAAHDEHDSYMVLRDVASTKDEGCKVRANTNDIFLLFRHFGVRLLGVSLSWLLWDIAFYGNKLFQSTFLLALTGEDTTTLLQFATAATLNSSVALCGYFSAAYLMDHPSVGRFRLQLMGFLLTGVLFVSVGFTYERLSPFPLVLMYLGSSFFGQLGPNATTFLIPAEAFPTQVRTFCHGVAAASGKMGALLASLLFSHLNVLDLFLLSGYASFAAAVITFWMIPESNGLDLSELDRKWRLVLEGRSADYDGPANTTAFLSNHERHQLQRRRQQHSSGTGQDYWDEL